MKRFGLSIILFALFFLAGCREPEQARVKAIVGAKLGSMEHSVVVIEGGKIRDVGPQSSTPVPKGAEITSGLGSTLVPASGGAIEPGKPADLSLEGASTRTMRAGEWVN